MLRLYIKLKGIKKMQNKEERRRALIEIADRLIHEIAEENALTGEIHDPLLKTIITIYKIADKIKDEAD